MTKLLRRPSAALTLLLTGLLGCHDATAPVACDGRLDLSITSGATPIISWSPKCGISRLTVLSEPAPFTAGETESVVWAFTVSELTPIGPGVRYGSAPRGSTVTKAAEALQSGKEYRVLVMHTLGGDMLAAMGERIFVP